MASNINSLSLVPVRSSEDGSSLGVLSSLSLLQPWEVRLWAASPAGCAAMASLVGLADAPALPFVDRLAVRSKDRKSAAGRKRRVIRARVLREARACRRQAASDAALALAMANARGESDNVIRLADGFRLSLGGADVESLALPPVAPSAAALIQGALAGGKSDSDCERQELVKRAAVARRARKAMGAADSYFSSLGARLAWGNRVVAADSAVARREARKASLAKRKAQSEAMAFLRGRLGYESIFSPTVGGDRAVAAYVLQVALQSSAKAVRVISGGKLRAKGAEVVSLGSACGVSASGLERVQTEGGEWAGGGREVNGASADDALGAALAALSSEVLRLAGGDWDRASRLCVPAFDDRTLLTERRRRSYLWSVGYRAAFKSLSALPVGITGRKGKLFLTDLTEWGRGAVCVESSVAIEARMDRPIGELPARRFSVLPSDLAGERAEQVRVLVWRRLGCVVPREWVPMAGHTYNQAVAQRASVRKWRAVCLMLDGVGASDALRRSGLSAGWVVNGKLRELLQAAGVGSDAVGGIMSALASVGA